MGRRVRIATVMIACIGISGCVTEQQKASIYGMQRPLSAAERAAVLNYVKTDFFDPYSMRDVSISNALSGSDPAKNLICLRANAKNRMGAYTGLRTTAILLNGSIVQNSSTDDPACTDARLQYGPFPELERAA
ncbi:hypothetical protein SAMN02745157_1531 [Kaistia soli DSM 19436]|uniref:Lipoprotein n=2 Tax=Kaistia TaxID=166953 RepID=A0A1M4YJJ2_9HYPH|nr:hypothetical protein SAMN02745157_1531 [Kaistia soli DSM 19436]